MKILAILGHENTGCFVNSYSRRIGSLVMLIILFPDKQTHSENPEGLKIRDSFCICDIYIFDGM